MVGRLAGAVGRGLFAGAVGTAIMTASSMLEMKLRDREPSTAPAKAVETVLDIEPTDEQAEERLSNLVHFAYGTAWGGVRGLLGFLGLHGLAAAATHFALVWGGALVMLPALRVAPPPTEWGTTEIAVDAFHHVVYAAATNAAFEALAA